jgi:hypothetical protein
MHRAPSCDKRAGVDNLFNLSVSTLMPPDEASDESVMSLEQV